MSQNKNNILQENIIKWYQMSVEDVLKNLEINKETGLNSNDAEARLKEYGYNELKVKKQSSLVRFLLQFHNALLYILMIAAVVCYFLGEYVEVGVIIAVVLATAIIGFIQEGKAEASLEALKKMIVPECTVIRDEENKVILTRELVPGDIVILEAGDRVPADLRLFSAKNLNADEAMLTGESLPTSKNIETIPGKNLNPGEQKCICFSGTFITQGYGKGVVIKTGKETEIGRIAGLMKETKKVMPPIIRKISAFTRFIIIAILGFSFVTFGVGIWLGQAWDYMFLAAVGMMVAMIPEGLPAVLIAAFAIGATAMAKKNALIKRLPAAETLGCTTVIASDKTGTLTKNEMTVVKIYCGDREYQLKGVGYEPKGEFIQAQDNKQINPEDHETLTKTLTAGYLCNHANLIKKDEKYIIEGDPTEGALITSAIKAGITKKINKIDEIPFESKQQHMATLHQVEGENIIYVKGSPEKVLGMCNSQLVEKEIKVLKEEQISEKASEMAKSALRVLGMAYKSVDKSKTSIMPEDINGLIFLGLQGMIDPPRPDAIEAIKKCKTAGIKSIMITGDHVQTAKAVAGQLGIGIGEERAITGEEISKMSDEELYEIVEKVSVYARVSPEHKFKIVKTLQKHGHIVAVTGDGVNDAPALKKADIGIAMGITGTEVSKEASDMVLIDNNFANIVNAVEEGRHIFNNIWKVILFLLPTNGGQGLVMAGAILMMPFIPIFATRLPIEPVQILWVNLIMAIACAIPLIWEVKEKGILEKPPRDSSKKLYNSLFILRVGIVSMISFVGALGLFLAFYKTTGGGIGDYLTQAQTIAFTTIIMVQLFYLFTARSAKSAFTFNPLSNKMLIMGASITMGLQLIIIYAYPLFGFSPFKTLPFPAVWWIPIILVSFLGFLAIEVEKFLRRRVKKFAS